MQAGESLVVFVKCEVYELFIFEKHYFKDFLGKKIVLDPNF